MTEPGLRERKKAETRAALQEHALRLFRQQGYAATTVDQIAAAANVSPATFFRYFPTKEDTVLYDAVDPLMVELFREQPAELTTLQAIRATLREGFRMMTAEQFAIQQQRHELFANTPELRSRMLEQYYDAIQLLVGMVAERTGREPDDLVVRTWAGAVVGIVMSVEDRLGRTARISEYIDEIDQALAQLEAGLPL